MPIYIKQKHKKILLQPKIFFSFYPYLFLSICGVSKVVCWFMALIQ